MCDEGYPCDQGGLDGVCCISCHRLDVCQASCNKAELLKKNREKGFRPDRCEHMTGGEEEEPKEEEA